MNIKEIEQKIENSKIKRFRNIYDLILEFAYKDLINLNNSINCKKKLMLKKYCNVV